MGRWRNPRVRLSLTLALLCAAPGAMEARVHAAEPLGVAVAASLRGPAEVIARHFEQETGALVRLSFGASNRLADQIRAGAPVDVLLSADVQIVEALERDGRVLANGRRELARNRLVVVAQPSLVITRPEDLLGPEVRRFALAHPAVPLGRYAREWLAARGLLEALTPRIVGTDHARAALAAVDLGHVSAALVYASDAKLARHARIAFVVPDAEQPVIRYEAAALRDARDPILPDARDSGLPDARTRALALRFLAFLGTPAATQALRDAGFRVPSVEIAP